MVGQHHRVVGKERAALIGLYEVEQEIDEDVGPVVGGLGLDEAAVALHRRAPVFAGVIAVRQGCVPQAVGVESPARTRTRVWTPPCLALQLPLSRYSRGVPGVAEQVAERVLVIKQRGPVGVVAHVAVARHDRYPARRADGLGERVVEAHAARRDRVEPGRVVLGAAVRAEHLIARVVGHDHHDARVIDVGHRDGGVHRRGHRRRVRGSDGHRIDVVRVGIGRLLVIRNSHELQHSARDRERGPVVARNRPHNRIVHQVCGHVSGDRVV